MPGTFGSGGQTALPSVHPAGEIRPMWLSRRDWLRRAAALAAAAGVGGARAWPATGERAAWKFTPEEPLIPAPDDPAQWPDFRRELHDWRQRRRRELNYLAAAYERPELAWTARNFACGFVMLNDEAFCDTRTGRYHVDRFLADAREAFGGFDSVVLWHAYPRLGLDARNQFDFYRDQPGGLDGLRAAIAQLRRAGVRVFLDYNPWDTQTRREGRDDPVVLAELVGALHADGVFLDTLDRGAAAWRAALEAARPGVALESELALPLEGVPDHPLSWAQWFADSPAPGVLRNRWFERRHQQHFICRWDRDHTAELHAAWMNGAGVLVWENVFGTWNGWCERDKAILRAMLPLQRRFAPLFTGEGWTPLVPTLQPGVYASLWEGPGMRVWTLVNRTERDVRGELLVARCADGEQVWDGILGRAAAVSRRAGSARPRHEPAEVPLTGYLPPRGIGCLIAGRPEAMGEDFGSFLEQQRETLKRANWSTRFPARRAVWQPPPALAPRAVAPPGMAAIPGGRVRLRTTFRVRECGFYDATHPHFETRFPALHGRMTFEREVALRPFALDLTPVTNADFARFLAASGWRPAEPANFLRHWVNGAPPPGREDHPVVYVDLADARDYAAWAGKRLPTEEEWQWAAQGPDGRRYPWGPEWVPGRCNDGSTGDTTPVDAFPEGRSPFGCLDLCGNVWEWTESERSDGRTRFAILRGGSFYRRGGSAWYFDEGPQPADFAAKVLLWGPRLDRCANVGFRCAADLPA
jgi:formylglycine-generating enzyme required for sulfatase activity